MTEVLLRPRSYRPVRSMTAVEFEDVAHGVPVWRGVSHEKAFAVAPALAFLLVTAADGRTERFAGALFGVTMTLMLGASALNHRARLGARWELRFRRADHAAIGLFMAGTWSALALVGLSGPARMALLVVVWAGALVTSIVTIAWLRIPGWLMAVAGVAAAWPAAWLLSDLGSGAHPAGMSLFVAGGIAYTVGAVGYALRRPNPLPAFGYHEVFHALVLAGVACHYATLVFFVLPASS
jgi:hemolysin III